MKLTDKTLALLVEGDPAEVEVLHFVRSPPISQVGHSSLYRCHRLVSLSLARLGLRTIDGDALRLVAVGSAGEFNAAGVPTEGEDVWTSEPEHLRAAVAPAISGWKRS